MEIAEICDAMEARLKAEAEERRREKISKFRRGERDGADSALSPKTRDVIANSIGVGYDTLKNIRYVASAAKRDP